MHGVHGVDGSHPCGGLAVRDVAVATQRLHEGLQEVRLEMWVVVALHRKRIQHLHGAHESAPARACTLPHAWDAPRASGAAMVAAHRAFCGRRTGVSYGPGGALRYRNAVPEHRPPRSLCSEHSCP